MVDEKSLHCLFASHEALTQSRQPQKGCSSHMTGWRVTNFCQPQAQHRLWLKSTSSPAVMVHDPPPLALSDIMHPFTPSPGHEGEVDEDRDRVHPEPSRTVSPEPLEQLEIDSVRSRLLQLGIGTSTEPALSTRERELADMVPGFSPPPPSRSNSPNLSFSDFPLPSDRIPLNSWSKLRLYTSLPSSATSYCNKPRRRSYGGMRKGTCGRELRKHSSRNAVRVPRPYIPRYASTPMPIFWSTRSWSPAIGTPHLRIGADSISLRKRKVRYHITNPKTRRSERRYHDSFSSGLLR